VIILQDRTALFISDGELNPYLGDSITFHEGKVTDSKGNTYQQVGHLGGTRWKCDVPGCTRTPRHGKATLRHYLKDHSA
jgi:hypothetical protein